MRYWQCFGFKPEAYEFLNKNCVVEPNKVCPHCGGTLSNKYVIVATSQVDSFYGDGPILKTYMMKNGQHVKEIIQSEPWSCGPCSFLCLELEDGTRIGEWTEDEINNLI